MIPDTTVIFILRLYSIYSRSTPILVTFSILLVAELATKIVCSRFSLIFILPLIDVKSGHSPTVLA